MAKKLSFCGLFCVAALMASYLEQLIPPLVPIPGIKLGLANIVILAAIVLFGVRHAFLINLVRIMLAAVLFGNISSFLYAFCGGMLSLLNMALLLRAGCFGLVGISAAGGVMHNVGQLLVAALMLSSGTVFAYFPVLLLSGVISGCAIGAAAWVFIKKLTPILPRIGVFINKT